MKNKMKHLIAVALISGACLQLNAQTDTLTTPGKPFTDPKATDDNSKVLINTSERMENLVDSLLEDNKVNSGKKQHPKKHNPSPEAAKSEKMVKQPADKTRMKNP